MFSNAAHNILLDALKVIASGKLSAEEMQRLADVVVKSYENSATQQYENHWIRV